MLGGTGNGKGRACDGGIEPWHAAGGPGPRASRIAVGTGTARTRGHQRPRGACRGRGRAIHDRDRQWSRDRGGRRRPPARRQRHRRDGGGPAHAEPGRAAILGHRRRRLHALLGRQGARTVQLRRSRDGAGGGGAGSVPEGGRHPMEFEEAVAGGRSVGVPGTLALLELAHRLHGRLPWAELVKPAAQLAERGFEISPHAGQSDCGQRRKLTLFPERAPISWEPTARRARPAHCCATRSSRRACARSPPKAAHRSIAAGSAMRSSPRCATRRSTQVNDGAEDLARYRAVLRETGMPALPRLQRSAAWGRPARAASLCCRSWGCWSIWTLRGWPVGGRHAGTAGGLQARFRRPQSLPSRQRLRPRARTGLARPGLPDRAGAADPPRCVDRQGIRRQSALADD